MFWLDFTNMYHAHLQPLHKLMLYLFLATPHGTLTSPKLLMLPQIVTYTPNINAMSYLVLVSVYFIWIYWKSCYVIGLIDCWRFFFLDTISENWWTGCVSTVKSYLMCHDVFGNLMAHNFSPILKDSRY